MVKRFKDNPGVLGYDLMNEPHDADLQDTFEINKLGELYKRVIEALGNTTMINGYFLNLAPLE